MSRIYPVIPLVTEPCADSIVFTLAGVGETIPIILRLQVGKSVTIHWGDGNTTVVAGTGANVTSNYTYSDGSYAGYICGDVDYLTVLSFGSTGILYMLQSIDASKMGSSVGALVFLGVGMHYNLNQFIVPQTNITSLGAFSLGLSTLSPNNIALTSLDLSSIPQIGSFSITSYANLTTLTLNTNLVIDDTVPNLPVTGCYFRVVNTKLNKVFTFNVNINPVRPTSTAITQSHYYYNRLGLSFTNYITLSVVEDNIEALYNGRANFTFVATTQECYIFFSEYTTLNYGDMSTGNYAVSGTYQAPSGYIQADAVTAGNDGIPASPMEMMYVLYNQCVDMTTTRKYLINIVY